MSRSELKQWVAFALGADLSQYSTVIRVSTPVDEDVRMRQEVFTGLAHPSRRMVPSLYLYSQEGSALFARITALPEYYPTRSEAALLKALASQPDDLFENILFPTVGGECQLIELGSGNALKTRIILDAWFASKISDIKRLTYIPVDVSEAMLTSTVDALSREYPRLRIVGLVGEYQDALAVLPPHPARLVLFLGGTIGNFDTETLQVRFFSALHALMGQGSRLLVGYDRQPHEKKPQTVIEKAYNDAEGLVSEFNLNLLATLNQRLGLSFSLEAWRHVAIYNEAEHQIEMYLESCCDQTVHSNGTLPVFTFEAGERIATLVSRKFTPSGLIHRFAESGYRYCRQWSDDRDEYVGILLLEA